MPPAKPKMPKKFEAAMKAFPKIVARKKKAFLEKKKRLKAFAPMARKLAAMTGSTGPDKITIVDEHLRRLAGSTMSADDLKAVLRDYDKNGITFPAKNKIDRIKQADSFDDLIAVWVDYFNKKFQPTIPLEPNVLKALIGSESGFRADPRENSTAAGITQITKQTLKTLTNPKGEAKDFIFKKILWRDLKDPQIAIPLATRWLFRKYDTAKMKLKRAPDTEELILEYKGLLKSDSKYKQKALESFRKYYADLKAD